ncbi:MAG: flagellar hook-basal body complex protein FliE [Pseudorhodoplanes sp.]|jgi:flagellar hook-basal body complex protein FliE|nr:flagellar hook-basal body complex protein FliE [Pseudorhodoplanes sp.]
MTSPIGAANAYASLAKITDPGGGLAGGLTKGATGLGGTDSFGAMVKDALTSVVKAGHGADAQTQAAVTGKANVVDVVTAVAESETAIETLVSVRDKVIQAYEEIMRMPI